MKKIMIPVLVFSIFLTGCFPYVYYNREDVLLEGINMEDTLKIAEMELAEGGFDEILTLWAIRDQSLTPLEAEKINSLYLQHIDKISTEFGVWHLAWAISDMYRLGDAPVKEKLEAAYQDAVKRPEKLKQFSQIADQMVNGEKITMGDIHDLGRSYARSHIIIPGNKDYLQYFDQYLEKHEKEKKKLEQKIENRDKWKSKFK